MHRAAGGLHTQLPVGSSGRAQHLLVEVAGAAQEQAMRTSPYSFSITATFLPCSPADGGDSRGRVIERNSTAAYRGPYKRISACQASRQVPMRFFHVSSCQKILHAALSSPVKMWLIRVVLPASGLGRQGKPGQAHCSWKCKGAAVPPEALATGRSAIPQAATDCV